MIGIDSTQNGPWHPEETPFIFEIAGELTPEYSLDTTVSATPKVYEYSWSLSHAGARPAVDPPHWWSHKPADRPLWERLGDSPAARVYIYFPTTSGWRVSEVTASVKYLSPTRVEHTGWDVLSGVLGKADPLVTDASSIAKLIPGGSAVSGWLDVVAKLGIQSVPQSKDFAWSAEKVTFPGLKAPAKGLMNGILFDLPKTMFELLGGRITGSIAVSFNVNSDVVTAGNLMAHACVIDDTKRQYWLPNDADDSPGTKFLQLPISPTKGA